MRETAAVTNYRCGGGKSASCGADGVGFDHEHYGALRGARAVHDAFGNDDSLARAEVDGTGIVFCGGGVLGIDEVDEQTAFDDVEEFVLPLMVVPVIVSLHDAEANDGIIYVAEGLVVPGVRGSVCGQLFFDYFEGLVPGFEDGEVREFGGHLRLLWAA